MKKTTFFIALFLAFTWVKPLDTAMTGGNFEISHDSFSTASGITSSTGGDFTLFDSVGNFASEQHTGGDFELQGGFFFSGAGTLSSSISPSSIELGTLSLSSVSSDSLDVIVTVDQDTGYTVSITEDGSLRYASTDIDDVSDGSVTAGSEEYGISTTGGDGLLSSDTAIEGTVNVASYTNNTPDAIARTTTVNFKASVGQNTLAGSYSHTVTFTVSVNP